METPKQKVKYIETLFSDVTVNVLGKALSSMQKKIVLSANAVTFLNRYKIVNNTLTTFNFPNICWTKIVS